MMSLSKEQSKFTYDKAKLILYAFDLGIQLTDGEAFRSQDQALLYYYGNTLYIEDNKLALKSAPKRSWTMNSLHLKRLAQDFNFFEVKADGTRELTYNYETLKPLGEYWESLDDKNKWGGFWKKPNGKLGKDVPHFERRV